MPPFVRGAADFFKELKRRKLYSAVVAYVALSLVMIEVGEALVEALELPDVVHQALIILLLLGFPMVVVLAWIFDLGPAGVLRTEARPADPAGPPRPDGGAAMAYAPAGSRLRSGLRRATPPPPMPRRSEPAAEPEPEPEAGPAAPPDPERVRRISLAHVRHELKTPINAIIGYSEMLLEDAAEAGDDAVASDLEKIRVAGRQLLQLVEQILGPDRQDRTDLEGYDARIRADLRDPVTAVIGYAEMLVEGCREGPTAWLVPDLERIRAAGLRLLELSDDIVQLATVAAGEAVPGPKLSRASVLAAGVLAKIRPRGADAGAGDRQGALLVVDDNAMNRDVVSRQLARKGYQVATAEHGREALEVLNEQPVDLVLLDVIMPEMDGIETLRRIKAQPALRDLPVIMMSSLDEIDGAIRCIEIGAADYLVKPIHPAIVDVRIGASLEVRRLREREELYRAGAEEADAATERLLRSLFPPSVAERLSGGETEIADRSTEVSALWCNLGRAVRGGSLVDPAERVATLGWLLSTFEAEAERQGLETLVVEGSAVLLVAGLPVPVPDHAERLAAAALRIVETARAESPDGEPVHLRFGLHTGSAAAAVIAGERLIYHVWGDAVDLARLLEAQAEVGQVHASAAVHRILKDRFGFEGRGVTDLPGRGQVRTYLLRGGSVPVAV